jgi:tetratricopeptide (TPR) repeat protein/DNA-binding CsgD family transcriptional regulator
MHLAAKDRNKALYHINRALQAHIRRDVDDLTNHIRVASQYANKSPRLRAYSLLLQALDAQAEADEDHKQELLHQALQEATSRGDARLEAHILLNLGSEAPDPRCAIEYTRQALRRYEESADELGISNACLNLGGIQLKLGAYEQGRISLKRALQLKQSLVSRDCADLLGIATAILNIASSYILQGNYSDGLIWAHDSVASLERLHKGNPVECARIVWQTSGWTSVSTECELLLANAYNNLGNIHSYLGDLDSALANYLRARELMCSKGNISGEAMVLNQIGEVFRETADYARAEEHYRQSLRLFEQARTRGQMYGVVLQSVGEVCAAQHKSLEAVDYYTAASAEFLECGNVIGEAEVQVLLGELYGADGDSRRAVAHLEKGLNLARSIAAGEIIVRGNRALGTAFMHSDSTRAREYLTRALGLAEDYGMKLEQQNIHRELASYYKLIGESTPALSHFEKFHGLQKEIHTENGERQLRKFEILHRVEQYKQSLCEMEGKVQQIESELEEKTRELASLAVRIMEKQEFIKLMEKGLNRIIKAKIDHKDILARELLDSIHRAGDIQSDWEDLTKRFLSVHREFAERLMQAAPGITPMEFQVCVLLRLSMGAKQIADVLNIEPKTVFNHQQSIRRKLNLINRENLKSHLILFEATSDEMSSPTTRS